MTETKKYILAIVAFLIVFIALSSFKLFIVINVITILICLIGFIYHPLFIFLLYVVFLPTNGLISTENNLFGVFHVTYTINLFATLVSLKGWKTANSNFKFFKLYNKHSSITLLNIARTLTVVLLIYLIIDIFSAESTTKISIELFLSRSVRYIILYIPLIFLSRMVIQKKYQEILFSGFTLSSLLISLGVIFSMLLPLLGIQTQEAVKNISDGTVTEFTRRAGVFAFGDENSVAGYLAICFCFFLFSSTEQLDNPYFYIFLIILILAIIFTGSRAGIVSFTIAPIFFLFVQKKLSLKIFLSIFIISTLSILFIVGVLDPILNRFFTINDDLDKKNVGLRMGGWLFYLDYITSNINIFFWGSRENIYSKTGYMLGYERVAHNYFITLVYKWGIFPFILYLILISKYIIILNKTKIKWLLLVIFLQLSITLGNVSDTGVFQAFLVSLILSVGMQFSYEK